MQLIFNNFTEFKECIAEMGYAKISEATTATTTTAPAEKKTTTTTKKPAPAKTEEKAPESKPETKEPEETTPVVTYEELLAYVQEHFKDNIQPVKDMLARVGAKKLPEIKEALRPRALAILKGEELPY